ncbi:MAG: 30S ribosomal protein S20 [Thiohalomonadaceae bacterium]
MANSAQAIKRARQTVKRGEHNSAQRSAMRTFVKKVIKAIGSGDKAEATAAYKEAVPIVDKMASKGLLHKNKAARYKSRLNNRIRAM